MYYELSSFSASFKPSGATVLGLTTVTKTCTSLVDTMFVVGHHSKNIHDKFQVKVALPHTYVDFTHAIVTSLPHLYDGCIHNTHTDWQSNSWSFEVACGLTVLGLSCFKN